MSLSSNKKKELTLQETFYNLCKDLIRYIDRKIIKKYIFPNQAQVPKEKRIKEKKYDDNKWRYFYEDEEITDEEKIRDIFKDNFFLFNLQHLYNSLNVIVSNMEENKNNIEILNKKLEIESQKLKLYGEINDELAKYSIENNINVNNLNQDDLQKVLEKIENSNILKTINKEFLQQFINGNGINNNNNSNNKNNLSNNQNVVENNVINNNIKENNIILNNNSGNNINNENNIQNKNKMKMNNSIPTLIQALESINKKNNKKKVFRKNNILDSDSNESSSDEENNEEEENEFNKNENKKEDKFKKIKFKREEQNKNILNKKTKRKNYKK